MGIASEIVFGRNEKVHIIKFGRSLLGFSPAQVINEIERIDSEHQQKIGALKEEVSAAREELKKSEEKAAELQKQLNQYMDREHMIAEVMLKAQRNAQRMEEEAREKARMMLEKSEEELKVKLQELELLRVKVERFREEFRGMLDEYKLSLETMKVPSGEAPFTPTLVVKEKTQGPVKNKDFSS
ncbi:MAG: hypothetical protein ACOY40_18835 [Bacillota bacterium]